MIKPCREFAVLFVFSNNNFLGVIFFTRFGVLFVLGYDNEDWFIPTPALKPEDADEILTPEQIRETLNYFREY